MKLSETVRYDDADPATVFGLICDEDFRDSIGPKIHAISQEVSVTRDGEEATIKIARVMPTEMPDFVKKLVGETVGVTQTEKWGAPDRDGNRKGEVEVHIKGQPASMKGTSTLRAAGGSTELTVDGDVTVKIPFIGKKIEPEIKKAIVAALRTEAKEGNARLKK